MQGSGIKAGRAFVLIEAVDMTGKVLNNIKGKINRFAGEMMALGSRMTAGAVAALTPIGMASRIFANFDDEMRKVEARSSGSAAEMSALREQAKELGRTTAFTASQIATLQAKLAQFGKSRADILKLTPHIMNLARSAGDGGDLGADITQAAETTNAVMAAFRLESEDTAAVTDRLAIAVNRSNYSLSELQTSLQYSAPVAKLFNMSLDDTLTMLATMKDLGVDASMAGTAFRNTLLNMSDAASRESFNKKLHELTGNTVAFTDAAGKLNDPLAVLVAIGKATEDLPDVEAAHLVSSLLGVRAVVPALGMGKAADKISKLRTELAAADGAAARIAKEMEGGLGGAFRELWSRVEGVAIAIGETLAPAMQSLIGYLMPAIEATTAWIERNRGLIVSVVAGIAAIGALGVGLIATGLALKVVAVGIGAVATVLSGVTALFGLLTAILSPAGLLLAATAAGLAAFAASGTTLFASLTAAAIDFKSRFVSVFADVGEALAEGDIATAWKLLNVNMQAEWHRTVADLTDAFKPFAAYIMSVWEQLKGLFGKIRWMIVEISRGLAEQQRHEASSWEVTKAWFGFDPETNAARLEGEIARERDKLKEPDRPSYNILQRGKTRHDIHKERIAELERQHAEQKALAAQQKAPRATTLDTHKKQLTDFAANSRQLAAALAAEATAIKSAAAAKRKADAEAAAAAPELPDIGERHREFMDKVDRMLADTITAAPAVSSSRVAPEAITAVEKGSIEAAKQFQQNLYNAERNREDTEAAKHTTLLEKILGTLEDSRDTAI